MSTPEKTALPDLSLPSELKAKLEEYRKKRNFNAEQFVAAKVAKYNEYLARHGLKAAMVSLSGGVDSAVSLGLMKRALDAPNSPLKRILAVAQPIHSSGWALARAEETAKALDVKLSVVDQTQLHNQLSALIDGAVGETGAFFSKGQLRSYMRTPVNYYVAQLLSQSGTPCVVMGTGNMDEDGHLAYFCKAGDGVVDIQLIADLHKSEVFKVGAVLGIPQSILTAPPSADLWEGQTDEEELGFSYDFVELLTGAYLPLDEAGREEFLRPLSASVREKFLATANVAQTIHKRNAHKFSSPVNINLFDTCKSWN